MDILSQAFSIILSVVTFVLNLLVAIFSFLANLVSQILGLIT
jgi:phage-related protein